MAIFQEIKDGLFSYKEANKGWVVKVKDARALITAAEKVHAAGIKQFDCFSPYPIHGLDEAMGLRRSWIPFITLVGGLTGLALAVSLMVYVSVIAWPQIYGGKPHFSWPAFVPIAFELTILIAGLSTVAGVIFLGRLGKASRKNPFPGTNESTLAIWVGEDADQSKVESILGDLVEEIRPVASETDS